MRARGRWFGGAVLAGVGYGLYVGWTVRWLARALVGVVRIYVVRREVT